MLRDIIKIEEGFQTSINIAYDLKDEGKIKKFIPTLSSIEIIEDIMLSVNPSSTQRARILIGAYGRGKSHIILVLLALLSRKDRSLFSAVMQKIKTANIKLYDYIDEYVASKRCLLPVVVSGSSVSLTQSFLNALQQTLAKEGLDDLMPDTHFGAALSVIENWSNSYADTYNTFIREIGEPIDEFISKLKSYDVSTYEKFIILYPKLTSGSMFNPFVGFDVVEIYEKVNEKLSQRGYDGLFIVYDEFSKYLESSILNASISDIKLLQDFAEKCNRSAYKQMHLLLICHKDISNYIDSNLPKDKVDGWRGVSGRFKHVELSNNFSQIYEIIASVIVKEQAGWNKYHQLNRQYFGELENRMSALGIFDSQTPNDISNIITGCFPLHPISTFILPRLSEKVAQNERTLFTFLSANEKNSLPAYLEYNDTDALLTPDIIYDYFEPLLRKEAYTSETHKIYKLTTAVLRKVDEKSLEAKIIKLLSLIYIVSQFEKLAPTVDVVVETFKDVVGDAKIINEALEKLLQKDCIVYLKRSNSYLKIKESSGVDIPSEVKKEIANIMSTRMPEDILNNCSFDNYLYPTRYNEEHDIIRYYDFEFIGADKLFGGYDFAGDLANTQSDGIVYGVMPKSPEEIERVKAIMGSVAQRQERIVFVLPTHYEKIVDIVYEYAAVNNLKMAIQDDEVLSDEYDVYIEDLGEVVSNYISSFVRPERQKVEYYYLGEKILLNRKAQLSALLSDICEKVFPYTPIINNESINKNILPTVAVNSRRKILAGILSSPLEKNLGLVGSGQEVSIMRSTLIRTGILADADTNPVFNISTQDANVNYVLNEIREFFKNAAQTDATNFSVLYNTLTSAEFGIGLKKGLIPIYLAVVIREVRDSVTILFGDKELKVTAELLNDINQVPEQYSVRIDEWSAEKEDYIKGLVNIFSDYIPDNNYSFNNFSFVVSAMSRWYLSLPKYAKELTEIYCGNADRKFRPVSKSKRMFINALKQVEINPRQFLFSDLFRIFGMSDFCLDILDNIKGTKDEFDTALGGLVSTLIEDVKGIFSVENKNATMVSVLKDWCEELNDEVYFYLFTNNENKVLELFKNATNDERQMIQRLAKALTSLRIEDWDSKTISLFIQSLITFKNTVEEHNAKIEKGGTGSSNSYKVSFASLDGVEITKTFEKIDYSRRAVLLKNEIETALEEMGHSISEQEKRQVLIEILEKLC